MCQHDVAMGPPRPRGAVQLVGTGLLLPLEVLALSLRFDTTALGREGHWWTTVLSHWEWAPQGFVTVAAAAFIFWGSRLRREFQRIGPSGRGAGPIVAGQLAAFAAFATLTTVVCEGTARVGAQAAWWFAAWLATGAVVMGLWLTALVPPSRWGPLVRRLAGVLVAAGAIGGAACWSGQVAVGSLWRPSSAATLSVVRALLGLVCRETVCEPESFLVGTPAFTVQIWAPCCGFEGIGLIALFLGVFFVVFRRSLRFPHALVLLPLGTAIIWLANAVRIAALVLIGSWWSPAVAEGGFHSQAGWLAFNLIALGLVALSRRWRWIAADRGRPSGAAAPSGAVFQGPTAAHLVPFLAVVATTMVTAALTSGFDRLYPLRFVAAGVALLAYRRELGGWRWEGSARSVALGAVAFGLWLALEPVGPSQASASVLAEGLAGLPGYTAALWIVFRVLGSVVTVPIVEELAFRGYLLRRLNTADFQTVPAGRFSWPSFLISSAVFGALHGRWLAGTVAGMCYALAYYRRGKLADAMLAHATTNALIVVDVLAFGRWAQWG